MPRINRFAGVAVLLAFSSYLSVTLAEDALDADDRIMLAQSAPRTSQLRLQSAIEKLQSGSPNYDEMEPFLRAAVQNQFSAVHSKLRSMGTIQTIEYVGSQNGQDIYNVMFENGPLVWGIQLSSNGKIAALYFN